MAGEFWFDRDVIVLIKVKKYQRIPALGKKYILTKFEFRQYFLYRLKTFNQ